MPFKAGLIVNCSGKLHRGSGKKSQRWNDSSGGLKTYRANFLLTSKKIIKLCYHIIPWDTHSSHHDIISSQYGIMCEWGLALYTHMETFDDGIISLRGGGWTHKPILGMPHFVY